MTIRKLTEKQQQTEQKKNLLYSEAIRLFITYGYNETTIRDICEATGMSVGSVYHFYNGKPDILKQFGRSLVGKKGLNLIEPTPEHFQNPKKAILNFYIYVANCFEDIGFNLSRHIRENYNPIWINEDGSYHESSGTPAIMHLIEVSQKAGYFDNDITTEEATKFLQTACEGVICSWVFNNGMYSLPDAMERFLTRLLMSF